MAHFAANPTNLRAQRTLDPSAAVEKLLDAAERGTRAIGFADSTARNTERRIFEYVCCKVPMSMSRLLLRVCLSFVKPAVPENGFVTARRRKDLGSEPGLLI